MIVFSQWQAMEYSRTAKFIQRRFRFPLISRARSLCMV